MMAYRTRILLGAGLGLLALVGLWFVGISWLTATVAALVAALGFLGSYFVWSADRPDEGYEQVLFDRSNTIVTAVLLLAFAGAGFGSGFLGGEDAPTSTADRVAFLYADYQRAANAYDTAEDRDAAEPELLETLATLRDESDRLAAEIDALPEGDERDGLAKANDAMAFAIDSLKACAGGNGAECQNARFSAADAQAALLRLEDE